MGSNRAQGILLRIDPELLIREISGAILLVAELQAVFAWNPSLPERSLRRSLAGGGRGRMALAFSAVQ
jgi:hypothetical protein